MDIGQGAGLAGASGVRPFLPPLLAGALARGDIGIDFENGDFAFLEEPAFLAGILALAVAAYALERSARDRRRVIDGLLLATAAVAGALLFAGSLTEGGRDGWIGLAFGLACAAIAYAATGRLFAGAARRIGDGAGTLTIYADALALALAGLAILVPPVSFLAIAAFLLLLVRGRSADGRKYEGLRILR